MKAYYEYDNSFFTNAPDMLVLWIPAKDFGKWPIYESDTYGIKTWIDARLWPQMQALNYPPIKMISKKVDGLGALIFFRYASKADVMLAKMELGDIKVPQL